MWQVFSIAMKKNLSFAFQFFVGNVINAIGIGPFGQGYQALRPHYEREVFRSSF